ncbi:unnamed protein product [Albugo candida]|uniref:Uncharacterized protein n=1 Tax=Albugo candida TaxID=65357 RepID=A0A024GVI0_9STRA|nr:unnamed protein product [Albugo candida]|eukprot:CCI50630.1 unnamed protein product [Albugo candida]
MDLSLFQQFRLMFHGRLFSDLAHNRRQCHVILIQRRDISHRALEASSESGRTSSSHPARPRLLHPRLLNIRLLRSLPHGPSSSFGVKKHEAMDSRLFRFTRVKTDWKTCMTTFQTVVESWASILTKISINTATRSKVSTLPLEVVASHSGIYL